MRGRAERRYATALKIERAKGIIRARGITEADPGDSMGVRAKKFATSHWGCACWVCTNPRKFWRGKSSSELTFAERRVEESE